MATHQAVAAVGEPLSGGKKQTGIGELLSRRVAHRISLRGTAIAKSDCHNNQHKDAFTNNGRS